MNAWKDSSNGFYAIISEVESTIGRKNYVLFSILAKNFIASESIWFLRCFWYNCIKYANDPKSHREFIICERKPYFELIFHYVIQIVEKENPINLVLNQIELKTK